MRSPRRAIGALLAVLGLILSVLSFTATAASADAPSECGSTFQGDSDAQLSIDSTPAAGSVVDVGDNIQIELTWPTGAWTDISKVLVCVQIDGVDSDDLFFAETPGVNDGEASYSFAVPEGAGEVCVVGRVSGQPGELNESDDTHKSDTLCFDVGEDDEDEPSISISKTPVAASVASGSNIGYAIVVTAGGTGTSEDVTVTDNLDSGYAWSEDHDDCSIAANVLTCDFGDMASGATETVNLTAPTTAGVCDTVDNTATVDASNIDGTPDGTDSTGNVITITGCGGGGGFTPPPPVLTPILSAEIECAEGGQLLTIRNTGDGPGTVDIASAGVLLADDLAIPAGSTVPFLVEVEEDDDYFIDVVGVETFEGISDCEEVEGVVVPAEPEPEPAVAPVEVAGVVQTRVLPRTGTDTLPLAGLGLGLIMLGAGLTLSSRRQLRVL